MKLDNKWIGQCEMDVIRSCSIKNVSGYYVQMP